MGKLSKQNVGQRLRSAVDKSSQPADKKSGVAQRLRDSINKTQPQQTPSPEQSSIDAVMQSAKDEGAGLEKAIEKKLTEIGGTTVERKDPSDYTVDSGMPIVEPTGGGIVPTGEEETGYDHTEHPALGEEGETEYDYTEHPALEQKYDYTGHPAKGEGEGEIVADDWLGEVTGIMDKHDIPDYVWFPIMMHESRGNRQAHNPSGEDSRGLFQINIAPNANPDLADRNLFDHSVNAELAAQRFMKGAYEEGKNKGLTGEDLTAYVWKNGIRPYWTDDKERSIKERTKEFLSQGTYEGQNIENVIEEGV